MSLPLRELERAHRIDEPPMVSLVGTQCSKCEMQVLVVRVGNDRMPVLLEVSTVTVVADSGRVLEGHPTHDITACLVREMDRHAQAEAADDSRADARWQRDGVLPEPSAVLRRHLQLVENAR